MRPISKRDIVRKTTVKDLQLIGLKLGNSVFEGKNLYSKTALLGSLEVKAPIERIREQTTTQILETIPTRDGIKRQIIAEAFSCHL